MYRVTIRRRSVSVDGKHHYPLQSFLSSRLKKLGRVEVLDGKTAVAVWPRTGKEVSFSLSRAPNHRFTHNHVKYAIELPCQPGPIKEARSVLAREHYLPPPQKGMLVGLRAVSGDDHSECVGAAVLDQVTHGMPVGRYDLAGEMGITLPPKPSRKRLGPADGRRCETKFRREVVRRLGVYCVVRIATRGDHHGTGLGSKFLSVLCEFAKPILYPIPKSFELMRVADKERARSISEQGGVDFATKAGFVPSPRSTPAGLHFVDSGDHKSTLQSLRRLYYYKIL